MKVAFHRLGDLCTLVRGTSPTLKTPPGDYPLVVTAEFRRSADSWQLEGPAVCVPLISSTGHGDAALHRVHYQEGKFALANLLVALLPKNRATVDARYLYRYLLAKKDVLFVPLMLGTANVSLKERDIADVVIPLPPLAEQQRIVARVEEISAALSAGRKLSDESVSESTVLARAARNQAYARMADRHAVAPIESLCRSITDGDHNTPPFAEDGVPFIFVGNVSTGKLHFSGAKHVTSDYFMKLRSPRVPEVGDVLYTAVGATLGIPAVVETDARFCFQRHIAILKPQRDRLSPNFLWNMLMSQTCFDAAWKSTTGSAQPTIPLHAIRALAIPVPPLAEQREVVAELGALQAEIDVLMHRQAQVRAELDALLPAILDRAFAGAL